MSTTQCFQFPPGRYDGCPRRAAQKPRPSRLLGQDPSKPIEYYQDQDRRQGTESCTGTASHEPHAAPATNAEGDVAQKPGGRLQGTQTPETPPLHHRGPDDRGLRAPDLLELSGGHDGRSPKFCSGGELRLTARFQTQRCARVASICVAIHDP